MAIDRLETEDALEICDKNFGPRHLMVSVEEEGRLIELSRQQIAEGKYITHQELVAQWEKRFGYSLD